MRFIDSSVQAIKSISQRALSLYWHRLAAGRKFPTVQEFNPASRLHDPKQLVFWSVESAGCFRAIYQGANVSEVFHSAWAGKTMDEVAPPSLKAFMLDAADECAASRSPIYTILTTVDANGNGVDCERLLLPLGEGSKTEQLVASLQLISLKGSFARKSVLRNFQDGSRVTFAGRVDFEQKPLVADAGFSEAHLE